MDERLDIEFRDGPGGRRASIVGGPDVCQVVREVRAARVAEPELSESERLDMLETNTGVSRQMILTALDYYRANRTEVDGLMERNERAAATYLAQLGGSEPELEAAPRRRPDTYRS